MNLPIFRLLAQLKIEKIIIFKIKYSLGYERQFMTYTFRGNNWNNFWMTLQIVWSFLKTLILVKPGTLWFQIMISTWQHFELYIFYILLTDMISSVILSLGKLWLGQTNTLGWHWNNPGMGVSFCFWLAVFSWRNYIIT